jgi:hypothetical protein
LIRFVVHLALGLMVAGFILKFGLDFNITALLTTSALITAIIGFAAQSTLAGLFSGIALQLERYIHPGDIIQVDGRSAQVEAISWRSITARRMDKTAVIVPNTTVAATALSVFRPGNLLRTEVMIQAPTSVPPAIAMEIIKAAASNIADVSNEHPVSVEVYATHLHDGFIDYRLRCFARATVIDDDPLASLIRLRVWYAYQRHGIGLAQPHPETAPALIDCSDHVDPDAAANRITAALAKSQRWRKKNAAEIERLIHQGRQLLYAPNEPILLPRDFDQAVATIVSGEVRLFGGETPDWIEPSAESTRERRAAFEWDIETLLHVQAQLAQAIGPYAQFAVRRVAREVTDLATLYRRLAVLIEDPQLREQFLQLAPEQPVRDFGRGTAFTVHCEGDGLAAPGGAMMALGQVELLAMPAHRQKEPQQDKARPASPASA